MSDAGASIGSATPALTVNPAYFYRPPPGFVDSVNLDHVGILREDDATGRYFMVWGIGPNGIPLTGWMNTEDVGWRLEAQFAKLKAFRKESPLLSRIRFDIHASHATTEEAMREIVRREFREEGVMPSTVYLINSPSDFVNPPDPDYCAILREESTHYFVVWGVGPDGALADWMIKANVGPLLRAEWYTRLGSMNRQEVQRALNMSLAILKPATPRARRRIAELALRRSERVEAAREEIEEQGLLDPEDMRSALIPIAQRRPPHSLIHTSGGPVSGQLADQGHFFDPNIDIDGIDREIMGMRTPSDFDPALKGQPLNLSASDPEEASDSDERTAEAILDEIDTHYLIQWAKESDTGESYEPSWELKTVASAELIAEWEAKKTATPRAGGYRLRERKSVGGSG